MDKKVLIQEDIHKAAKIAAAKAGVTLSAFIGQAVANATKPYLLHEHRKALDWDVPYVPAARINSQRRES